MGIRLGNIPKIGASSNHSIASLLPIEPSSWDLSNHKGWMSTMMTNLWISIPFPLTILLLLYKLILWLIKEFAIWFFFFFWLRFYNRDLLVNFFFK